MSTSRDTREEWHVAKEIPVALIVVVLIQAFGFGWWGSSMSTRVDQLERQATAASSQSERIVRLEEKIGGIQQGISEIKSMMRPAQAPAPQRMSDPG